MSDIERRLRDLAEDVARDAGYRVAPAARIVRRARLRRALTVATPALAVVLLAGVALPRVDWPGGSTTESSLAMLSGAIDATEGQGSARVEVEFEFDTGSEVVSSRATGVIDFETGRARLRTTYTDDGYERVVEMITDGQRTYERPVDSPDAKWYERLALPPGAAAGPPDSRPAEFLRYVESVASEVTRVGAEVRDGVPVTRYRAVLDPAKVTEASGQEVPEGLEVELAPMDVWVDEQGRVREATFGGTTTVDDFSQTMRGSIRFFDFGTPAEIELPGPDEITEKPPVQLPEQGGPVGNVPGTDTLLVTSSGGLRRPYLIVTSMDEELRLVCVQAIEARPSRALVVEEETGRAVVTLRRRNFDFSGSPLKRRVGCAPAPAGLAHRITDDPEAFVLRIRYADAPPDEVPLEQSGPVAEIPPP